MSSITQPPPHPPPPPGTPCSEFTAPQHDSTYRDSQVFSYQVFHSFLETIASQAFVVIASCQNVLNKIYQHF